MEEGDLYTLFFHILEVSASSEMLEEEKHHFTFYWVWEFMFYILSKIIRAPFEGLISKEQGTI